MTSSFNSLQSRTLRRLYLTLFLRGRTSRGLSRGKEPNSVTRKLAGVLTMYLFIGALMTFTIGTGVFLTGFYLHTMGMLFTGMFVSASAGEVLFSKDEQEILGYRPVDPRQLLWAKASVLIQVAVLMGAAYSLAGCIRAIFVSHGGIFFPFAHLFSMALSAIFGTGAVVMLYQLCLRWFGRERLDNLMTTAQVMLTLSLILGSQMIRPMLMKSSALADIQDTWWIFFIPPAWFTGLDAVLTGNGDVGTAVLSLLAIIATVTVGGFAFGRLADSTQEELVAANETLSAPGKSYARRTWIDRIIAIPPFSLVLRHPVIRASFRLTVAYMLRDRDTKLRLFPGLAPIVVMPLVFLFGGMGGGSGFGLAFASAYMGLIPLLATNLLQFSQDWQAADILRLGPAGGPQHFIRGSLWAIFLVLMLPAIALLVAAGIYQAYRGSGEPLLMALPGLIAMPAYALVAGATSKAVPLSRPTEESKSAGRGAKMMLLMFSAIAIGLATLFAEQFHYLPFFLVVMAIASTITCVLANRSIGRVRWDPME